ncbi:hypothetical protein BDM02DRAFT_2059295 [Thelephora ganbajun]|uniref:Uncharacterized protein n=1 Tax=Thelephora ganbajun TaxID=370292 RepID=A0ACB6ZGD2_THEGA|nr:hypothetical protein BDM02DRAFT_2059295 [Thelephora ganbajun]
MPCSFCRVSYLIIHTTSSCTQLGFRNSGTFTRLNGTNHGRAPTLVEGVQVAGYDHGTTRTFVYASSLWKSRSPFSYHPSLLMTPPAVSCPQVESIRKQGVTEPLLSPSYDPRVSKMLTSLVTHSGSRARTY